MMKVDFGKTLLVLTSNNFFPVNNSLFQKLVPNPAFVVDGVSRFDFGQGNIGKLLPCINR